MNHPPTHADNFGPEASQAKRFTYPGGSRPLDGYTIKRGVGHGGFGEVYYATSDAGKEVALKLIRRSLDIEIRGIKQCLNLKHQNLLGVFDIKEDSRGDHWVIMEYVAGECLDEVIARYPDGMPVEDALAWAAGIGAGVGYLHDHGIVHRDLKPGNIFSEEGRVAIGDYGLSKFISCSRRSGHTESVGTVHYMAPEVANGRYGKEIDIYALGIILYEMLTGRLPFEGESVGEVLMKHLTAKPDVSMIDEPYRSVIAKALEKDPEQRYSSVEEMLAALPIDRAVLPHARITQAGPSAGASNGNGSAQSKSMPFASEPSGEALPVAAQQVDEEPILRELRKFWETFCTWWKGLTPGAQVGVAIAGVFALMLTAGTWIPLGVLALIGYGIYRIIRAIVLSANPKSAAANTLKGATGVSPVPSHPAGNVPVTPDNVKPNTQKTPRPRKHYRRFRPQEQLANALIVKPLRERIADLLGSMLLAAVVAIVITTILTTLITLGSGNVEPEFIAYIVLVSIAGSWTVLIPAKFWEGTNGDAILRRFVMMTLGLGLGAFAYGCSCWLFANPMEFSRSMGRTLHLPMDMADNTLAINIAFSAGLMFLIRWWRQADPLRHARLSFWYVVGSIFPAFLLTWMEHPAGLILMIIAGIMSASVQIASPWINPRLRQANPEE